MLVNDSIQAEAGYSSQYWKPTKRNKPYCSAENYQALGVAKVAYLRKQGHHLAQLINHCHPNHVGVAHWWSVLDGRAHAGLCQFNQPLHDLNRRISRHITVLSHCAGEGVTAVRLPASFNCVIWLRLTCYELQHNNA